MSESSPHFSRTPTIFGTGLLALDVISVAGNDDSEKYLAGGTCGNVLLACKYLGWNSTPIARLGRDESTSVLIRDLKRWSICCDQISVSEDGSTPIIFETIHRPPGRDPYHSFSLRCPDCGERLPWYKPVLVSSIEKILDKLDVPDVFFFDRVSRASIILAKAYADRGAVIVFEPSSIGNVVLFKEAWSIAHIVKYSHERLSDIPFDLPETVLLQIETLGREGLRYKSLLSNAEIARWTHLKSFHVAELLDSAGAGDWCTAGVIQSLATNGLIGLRRTTSSQLRKALDFGQALAAWTCGFDGPRGGMYVTKKEEFEKQIQHILKGAAGSEVSTLKSKRTKFNSSSLCPACSERCASQRNRHSHRTAMSHTPAQ